MSDKPFDSREFRDAMGSFLTGVTVITALDEKGIPHGMTANAFTSVSLEPPIILVCLDHRSKTLQHISKTNKFGVNILSEDQKDVSKYFANQHLETIPEFELNVDENGVPLLKAAITSLSCRVIKTEVMGDHTVFYGEVDNLNNNDAKPLGFLKGKYVAL